MSAENVVRMRTLKGKIENQGPFYLNNFFSRVPVYRNGIWEYQGWLIDITILPGFGPDIPFSDFYPPDSARRTGENRHSPLFWSLTPGMYFDLIKKALETEVGLEAIKNLQHLPERSEYAIEINRISIPAYLKLVEMGFSWRDLSE